MALDLLGIFVFALEGAMASRAGHFDALGVLVLSFATALGGGIRDLPMNRSPGVLHTDIYAVAAIFGATVMVLAQRRLPISPSVASFLGGT